MAEIVVREAVGAADLGLVRELMRAYGAYLGDNPAGAANICLEGFERELDGLPAPYVTLLVAFVDGVAAGCVALKEIRAEERGCEMKRLWVGERFRGLGLGKRLAVEAIDWARGKGYGVMYLDTVPAAMPEANRLYEAMGFVRVERYNDNPVAEVVFFRLGLGA